MKIELKYFLQGLWANLEDKVFWVGFWFDLLRTDLAALWFHVMLAWCEFKSDRRDSHRIVRGGE